MANPDCKQIEKHIKDMLFNGLAPSQPIGPPGGVNRNHSTFTANDQGLLSNIENIPQVNPLLPHHSTSQSELIDFNVLTNFAAQHIDGSPFPSPLDSKELILPHPDLEDDGRVDLRNGENGPGIHGLLNTITKEIQNSPHFLSMPENPLPQVIGTPKKAKKKQASVGNVKKPVKEEKNEQQSKRKSKNQNKQKRIKERMEGLYIEKESSEGKDKVTKDVKVSKEVGSRPSPDVKVVAKRQSAAEEVEESCIKLKKNPLSELNQEYFIFLQDKHYKFQCSLCNYNTEVKEGIIKHVTLKNHLFLKEQADLDMMLPFLPPPLVQQTEAISELLSKTVQLKGLTDEHRDARTKLCSKLKEFVEENLPTCTVELFGSSATGCALKNSEVDFVLKVTSDENLPDCLEKLFLLMKSNGDTFLKVLDDFRKKRPCIKFTDSETNLSCNILIDTSSCLKLANLLDTYFKLDKRVLTLGIVLRYWAKICDIDQQESGTFPPFSFSLMLIHFLQQVQPPVLPVLHEVKDYASTPEFYENYLKSNKWKCQNSDSLGELFLKFFHFYNFEYKLGEHVVCIRNSKRITCKERNWSTRFYAIEDPFLRRNLAYVIPTFQVCTYIEQCFLRTYRYFAYPQLKKDPIKLVKTDSFDVLKLSEYISNKPIPKREESDDSENEDSDSADVDLEDHDPDLPLYEFVSTVANLSLKETTSESESSSTVPKSSEKAAKDNVGKTPSKANAQPLCYWDVEGRTIIKDLFCYEFNSVTFKGDKPFPLTCKLCKSSGHRKKDCPVDNIPEPVPLPTMTPEFLKIITKVLYSIRDQYLVSKAELDYINADMHNVQRHIREVFPDASLKLFGSFCNGFGFKNQSDMDFCLTFGDRNDGKDLDNSEVIEKVAKELRQHPELVNVLPITSAKVPIVKFTWRKSGLEGDISLYNTLALANTKLLEAYSKIDVRVQVLGYAFKHFAKLLGICDASRGSLSSYAYILMVIFFLQQRNPPVIPVLQELHDDEKPVKLIDSWNVWFYRDIDNLKKVWSDYGKNKESVGELWVGLLNFYACDFDWKEFVISIKQKSPLTRFRKLWINTQLAIEDPFDLNHNLGGGLSRKMNTYIMKTFIRARERFGTPVTLDKTKFGSERAWLFNRHYLNSGAEPPQDRGCSNCGKIGHIAKNCPQEKACSYCRVPGHLIKNCPKKGRGKKNNTNNARDRERNLSFDKPNTERRNSNEKQQPQPNQRVQNQNLKQDYNIQRTYPGMQQPPNPKEAQKLLQMGVPTHRLPPPGFHNRNPPPGFNNNNNGSGFQGPSSYPPPFNAGMKYAHPFPRGNNNDMLASSPPRNFPASPPKNFPPFHQMPWAPSSRQGFKVERHPAPQMGRPMLVNPQQRWQPVGRPMLGPHKFPSNQDHRLHRSNSDSYGSDIW
ncbi:hypothetical protein JTE90_003057 [Oedothorax gibbosus]|uniref:CCHC-type domain-containing protein n=1 Tax=Oedothorax gibbosus TaxID=931172 RepID=A0AAV6VBY4_9ARAC|nr:hypothetical protein JTE90_003057 [Oedothorax gibbosus]